MARYVVHPAAIVQVVDGNVVLTIDGPDTKVFTSSPELLRVLSLFCEPRTVEEALRHCEDAARKHLELLCIALVSKGVLSPIESRESALTRTDTQRMSCMSYCGPTLDALSRLATDLRSVTDKEFDDGLVGDPREMANILRRLHVRLALWEDGFARVANLRKAALSEHVARQEGLLKVQLGAGDQQVDGWINFDLSSGPWPTNLERGIPLADETAGFVYLCHVLEHFTYPEAADALLAEVARILAPAGIVRVVVPHIARFVRAYCSDEQPFFALWRQKQSTPEDTPLECLLKYAGAGALHGELTDSHKFGYDAATIEKAFARAGLLSMQVCGYNQSRHEELRIDHHSSAIWGTDGTASAFFEARKPRA